VDSSGTSDYISIAIGVDGFPVISYFNGTTRSLKVAHCNDLACSISADLTTVDSNSGSVGQYSSITIGADGLPVISYYDLGSKNLKVAHCNDLACSSAALNTLDNDGDVGYFTSITIGTDGLPIISYTDYTNYDLKIAHCNDFACSSATLATLDSPGIIGGWNSITIGADGMPVISYGHSEYAKLKVAHCNDRACTSATLATLDNVASNYTSITIGTDGLPLISYIADPWPAKDVLKVAHCSNALCIPNFRRR
jgi:hypothetical protein